MISCPVRIRGVPLLALGMSLWLGSGSLVHADNLDSALLEQGQKILEALQKNGYQTVGLLRCRVQLGNKEPSFTVGPLNGTLPDRLENALILHLGMEAKVGILHDASRVASQAKIGNWFSVPAERKKLFDVSYPLAWGDKKVKASAFVTGLVKVSPDYTKANVILEAFSAKEPAKMVRIAELNVETDTELLHDLGKTYSVSLASNNRKGVVIRKLALEAVRRDEESPPPPQPPASTSVMVGDSLEVQLLADDKPIEIRGTELECPEPGKVISVKLTNKSKERLGVDVKLNGISLLLEQKDEAEACRVFVMPPGSTSVLKGYYTEGAAKNVSPLKVLVGEEAKQAREELGEKAGLIQITVFAENPGDPPQISRKLRGLKPADEKTARKDLASLQNSLLKSGLLKKKVETVIEDGMSLKRELIVKDEEAEKKLTESLTVVDFKRTAQAPQALTLKVLPRAGNGE